MSRPPAACGERAHLTIRAHAVDLELDVVPVDASRPGARAIHARDAYTAMDGMGRATSTLAWYRAVEAARFTIAYYDVSEATVQGELAELTWQATMIDAFGRRDRD